MHHTMDSDLVAYNKAADQLELIVSVLVVVSTQECTPKQIHDVLEQLRDAMHPHMEPSRIWNRALHRVREHVNGCPTKGFSLFGNCGHEDNCKVHPKTAPWLIAYLEEQRDGK